MQINPGKVAATVVPSGLQMKDLNVYGETQIGPGMVAPLATPTAPCGLEVSSLNLSTTEIS